MADEHNFHNKIARAVHASPVSAEYDLHGYTEEQCNQLGEELFARTFRVPEQFRISFIIGGGREVRQKYDANLSKWLTAVLRHHGFEDDNAASAVDDCQKKFKYQDDTGKNVKRLHVFPHSEIVVSPRAAGGGAAGPVTPEDRLIRATEEELPALLDAHVPTWLQLRRAQHVLAEFGQKLDQIEAKMIKVQPLTEAEAELYESDYADKERNTRKAAAVGARMKAKVAAGELTPAEKEHLIEHAQERLESLPDPEGLGADAAAAAAHAIENVKERIATLEAIEAHDRPLAQADKILKTWKKMKPLEDHDVRGPNKRAALDELPVLEAKVAGLITESKDWFETAEELKERVADLRSVFKGQTKKKKGTGGGHKKASKGMSKKAQLRAAKGL